MMNRIVLFLAVAIALSGCGGLQLQNEPLNRSLPNGFKNRAFLNMKGTEILRHELDDLAGQIIVCKAVDKTSDTERCDLAHARITKQGTPLGYKLIEGGEVYKSKIDQGAKAEGSYLLFAAGFSIDQIAEVTITDISYVYIKSTDVPLEQLRTYVRDHRKGTTEKRYWVQGLHVASIVRRDYVKYEGNGNVTGPITNIKGATYRADDSISHDYGISFLLADIDADIPPPLARQRTTPEVFMAPERKLIIESVTGLEQLPPAKR